MSRYDIDAIFWGDNFNVVSQETPPYVLHEITPSLQSNLRMLENLMEKILALQRDPFFL